MRRLLLPASFTAIMLFLLPALAFAQERQDYQLLKSDTAEGFAFPYSAANLDADNPLVYTYEEPKGPSWIMSIRNNLTYVPRDDAKTIIRLQDAALPEEKYVEIAMFGGQPARFWVAAATPETGYARMHDNNITGWVGDNPIAVSYGENSGLTVTNGKRVVVDRLDMEGFSVGSVAVYGKDEAVGLANAYAGSLGFEILFGSFNESPLFLVPAGITAGVGALIIGLLVFKKRKASDY